MRAVTDCLILGSLDPRIHLHRVMILHVYLDDSDSIWMSLQQLLQLGGPARLASSSHDMVASSNELSSKLQAYAP